MPEQDTVWNPQTELGRKVARGETTSIESALETGQTDNGA